MADDDVVNLSERAKMGQRTAKMSYMHTKAAHQQFFYYFLHQMRLHVITGRSSYYFSIKSVFSSSSSPTL